MPSFDYVLKVVKVQNMSAETTFELSNFRLQVKHALPPYLRAFRTKALE